MTPGSLAFIKTTGEQVMVAGYPDTDVRVAVGALSGTHVLVIRPVAGQGGIDHKTEFFPIELLETAEARFNREYEEFSELQAKARVSKAEAKLSASDAPTLN